MEATNKEWLVQGQKAVELIATFGSPLFVYNAEKIIQQINLLKNAFDSDINVEFKFACKALTNLSILRLMKIHGIGLDTVSPQEFYLGIKAGFNPSAITFTPSGAHWIEIKSAVDHGIMVTLDNLSVLEKFGQEFSDRVPCMIRIRPNVISEAQISVGDTNSKFGIDIQQKEEILRLINKYRINVVGLHQHTGTGIENTDSIRKSAAVLFDLGMNFPKLRIIDLGGGFKVAYKPEEKGINLISFGQEISKDFREFRHHHQLKYGISEMELWFEPGKFLVAEAGYLFTTVTAVKKDFNKTFVCLDSGLNHLIRPMFYKSYHKIANVSNLNDSHTELYDVVGYICETDTFGERRLLNKVSEGDVLVIENAGAYGFSMSSNYCGRLRPAEVLILGNKARLIRKQETLNDLIFNQIVLSDNELLSLTLSAGSLIID